MKRNRFNIAAVSLKCRHAGRCTAVGAQRGARWGELTWCRRSFNDSTFEQRQVPDIIRQEGGQ